MRGDVTVVDVRKAAKQLARHVRTQSVRTRRAGFGWVARRGAWNVDRMCVVDRDAHETPRDHRPADLVRDKPRVAAGTVAQDHSRKWTGAIWNEKDSRQLILNAVD